MSEGIDVGQTKSPPWDPSSLKKLGVEDASLKENLFSKICYFLSALFSGALIPFAFSPFDFWGLAILAPAILLMLWQDEKLSPKIVFWLGFTFGLGMFGVGVSWVFVSIHRYGGTDIPLAIFITSLLVFLLSVFPALQGYVLKRWFKGNHTQFLLLGFPSIWVLFEWIRSVAFTGFPWLFLGYTELNTPLKGFAPIGSVYLVSLMVVLTSASLIALLKTKHKILPILLLFFIWGLGILLNSISWTTPFSRVHTVSLVQGNIPLMQKFNQKDPISATEQTYGKLSEPYWGQDLILWPESAILLPLPYAKSYLEVLGDRAKKSGGTLITGIQVINSRHEYYNSLVAVGNGTGIYHKTHLLPYGDYLPFESWLRGLISFFDLPLSSFSRGTQNQALIQAGDLKLNPQICYEIAFPELIRDTLREATVIVNLTEDGWFGDSFGPHQHLQISRMRAVETGRPLLRSTRGGITAIINPDGKIQIEAPPFQATVLSGSFQPMQGQTPWMILGIWPLGILLILMFILPGRIKFKS